MVVLGSVSLSMGPFTYCVENACESLPKQCSVEGVVCVGNGFLFVVEVLFVCSVLLLFFASLSHFLLFRGDTIITRSGKVLQRDSMINNAFIMNVTALCFIFISAVIWHGFTGDMLETWQGAGDSSLAPDLGFFFVLAAFILLPKYLLCAVAARGSKDTGASKELDLPKVSSDGEVHATFNENEPREAKQNKQIVKATAKSAASPQRSNEIAVASAPKEGLRKAPIKPARPSAPKPSSWQAVIDPESGETYYYNQTTQETTWDKPPDL